MVGLASVLALSYERPVSLCFEQFNRVAHNITFDNARIHNSRLHQTYVHKKAKRLSNHSKTLSSLTLKATVAKTLSISIQ